MKKLMTYILLIVINSPILAQALYPFATDKQEAQFKGLLKELRCLVCQNQDLADSHATLAQDLRLQVYEMVNQGKTDTEIIDYLTHRYGDFILFNPPVKSITLVLWFAPIGFLLIGLTIWLLYFKRQNND